MDYIIHNFSYGTKEFGEGLKEIPKVFQVQYWPWTEDPVEPQPMVIARYELVEVVEGELPQKKMGDRVRRIAAKMEKVLDEEP